MATSDDARVGRVARVDRGDCGDCRDRGERGGALRSLTPRTLIGVRSAVAAVAVLALSACTMNLTVPEASSAASVNVSRNYTPPATPAASAAPPLAATVPRPPTLPGPTVPGMPPAPQNIGAAVPGEYLGDLQVHLAVDLGTQPHATGTVTTDASGTPISYTVAADDDSVAVSHRFGLNQYMLIYLNCVRRMDDRYYIGDTINLDAETITTVGDENGEEYAFVDRLPNPHPPQH